MESVGKSYFMLHCLFHLLTGPHIFKLGLELSMQRRLAPRVRSSSSASLQRLLGLLHGLTGMEPRPSGRGASQNRAQEGSCVRRM